MRTVRTFCFGMLMLVCLTWLLAGCGDGDDTAKELSKQEELRQARQQGAQEQRLKELERDLRAEKRKNKGNSGSSSQGTNSSSSGSNSRSSSGSTSCGGGLSVGSSTSCPFAEQVQSAYPGSTDSFDVYSPVTGKTYSVSCTGGSPHVCTSTTGATVYLP